MDVGASVLADLPHAGYSGPCIEPFALEVVVVGHDEGHLGPGSDNAHIPGKNVPELGKLVKKREAKKSADRRDPWIIEPIGAGGILGRVLEHRSEFEYGKGFSSPADPHLTEDCRPR